MLGLRRALLALFVLGVLFAGLDVALVADVDHEDQKVVTAILGPLIGLSFIGTGVFAWWRRPLQPLRAADDRRSASRGSWPGWPSPTTSTRLHARQPTSSRCTSCSSSSMVLSFPTGRLETSAPARDRRSPATSTCSLVRLPFFLLGGDISSDLEGPAPGQRASPSPTRPTSPTSSTTRSTFVGVAVAGRRRSCCSLRKRRAATPPQRRAQAPMLWTGPGAGQPARHRVRQRRRRRCPARPSAIVAGLLALVAFAILPVRLPGRPRAQPLLARRGGRRAHRAPQRPRRRPVACATRWPTRSATARSSSSTGASRPATTSTYDGRPVELPERGLGPRGRPRSSATASASARSSTTPSLRRRARASCAPRPPRPRWRWRTSAWRPSCAPGSRSCRPRAPGSSRSRWSSAARLERDLHDGAQQRLVALSLQLGLAQAPARGRARTRGGRACSTPRATSSARALEELRELARGIHPAVLTDRGLERRARGARRARPATG